MMLSTLATIWVLHVAAMMTPGANTLLVSQLAASGHGKAAAYAAVGVAMGACLWATAAVSGVSALFAAFPAMRVLLQVAGASYLLYLAGRMWRSAAEFQPVPRTLSATHGVRAGIMTNMTNPKSAVFFGSVFSAVLPADPGKGLFAAVVLLIVANALWWHLLLAFLFSRGSIQAGYAAQRRMYSRIAAGLLGAIGAGLFFSALAALRNPGP